MTSIKNIFGNDFSLKVGDSIEFLCDITSEEGVWNLAYGSHVDVKKGETAKIVKITKVKKK